MILSCNECGHETHTDRHIWPRFQIKKKQGQYVGNNVIVPKRCRYCQNLQYLQSYQPFIGYADQQPELVTEEQYNSAAEFAGTIGSQSTASMYTRKIAQDAEVTAHYLRTIKYAQRFSAGNMQTFRSNT